MTLLSITSIAWIVFLSEPVAPAHWKKPVGVTENGLVIGRYYLSGNGTRYMQFLGIPYAEPPTGENRFEVPKRLRRHWQTPRESTKMSDICMQYSHSSTPGGININQSHVQYKTVGSEDCLYLNIYTHDLAPSRRTVIVFIHGGAFMFGSGNSIGPDYLMDRNDIVFVTVNYRLGPLGFLSTGDDVVPGNNGLKDQVAALEWIRRNIANFGGNPDDISLTGMSAGGASVHYHYLSTLSKGLFHKGISISGCATTPWALVSDVPEKTRKLAAIMNCPTETSHLMVKCLKTESAISIVQTMNQFQVFLYNPFTVFGPVIEPHSPGSFITEHPMESMIRRRHRDLPWLTTTVLNESLYPASEFIANETLLSILNEDWENIAPFLLFYNDTKLPTERAEIAKRAREAYLGGEEITEKTISQLVDMISDRLFVVDSMITAIIQADHNINPTYYYRYLYRSVSSCSDIHSGTHNNYGVSHGDDIFSILKIRGLRMRSTPEDKRMAEILTDVFVTFSKTGSPPSYMSNWKPVEGNTGWYLNYLKIVSPDNFTPSVYNARTKYKLWHTILDRRRVTWHARTYTCSTRDRPRKLDRKNQLQYHLE